MLQSKWFMVNGKCLMVLGLIILAALFVRVYKLTSFPPSLYWEEVALGYDAYSIAQTGRDHHGHWFPIVAFESFGDFKPALYVYAIVPFVAAFGLNEWAVRFPAVLAGVGIVAGVGYLAWLISDKNSAGSKRLVVIAMLVTAFSPWTIQFSRAGWEVNLATCLIVWAMALGIHFIQHRKVKWLYGAVVLLVLSMYTYHAARLIAPALGLSLVGVWFWSATEKFKGSYLDKILKFLNQNSVLLLSLSILSCVLLLPLILSFGQKSTGQRFAETSIFSDLSIIEESNARKELEHNSLTSRLLYHRYVLFGREMLINYLSHFSFDLLFITGDVNARHSIQFMGQLYYLDFVFLILGAYWLIKFGNRYHWLLVAWLLISIFPASITNASPDNQTSG